MPASRKPKGPGRQQQQRLGLLSAACLSHRLTDSCPTANADLPPGIWHKSSWLQLAAHRVYLTCLEGTLLSTLTQQNRSRGCHSKLAHHSH